MDGNGWKPIINSPHPSHTIVSTIDNNTSIVDTHNGFIKGTSPPYINNQHVTKFDHKYLKHYTLLVC